MRSARRSGLGALALLGLLGAGCGGEDGAATPTEDDVPTTTETTTTTVPPPTTIATWTTAADILTVGTAQALPPLGSFADALRRENARLGATDGLDHDADDATQRLTMSEGVCTEIGFSSYFYEADVALTDTPSVGILAPAVQVYVCPDSAALSEQATELLGIHDGTEGLECPVDRTDSDGLGTQVCPNQTLEGTLTWWNSISLGSIDLALVAVTGDLAPATDPVEGAASFDSLLDDAIGHLDERLG